MWRPARLKTLFSRWRTFSSRWLIHILPHVPKICATSAGRFLSIYSKPHRSPGHTQVHASWRAWEVSPAEISNVPRDRLAGIVSVHGSALSHTSDHLPRIKHSCCNGSDRPGHRQIWKIATSRWTAARAQSASILRLWTSMRLENACKKNGPSPPNLKHCGRQPAPTLDGVPIPIHVNLGGGADELSMNAKVYEGVGLYRTEFSFMARDTLHP